MSRKWEKRPSPWCPPKIEPWRLPKTEPWCPKSEPWRLPKTEPWVAPRKRRREQEAERTEQVSVWMDDKGITHSGTLLIQHWLGASTTVHGWLGCSNAVAVYKPQECPADCMPLQFTGFTLIRRVHGSAVTCLRCLAK